LNERSSRCEVCGQDDPLISKALGVCVECIRNRQEEALPWILEAHRRSREPYGLPPTPPRTSGGVQCNLCANSCRIGEGEKGYCGLRSNIDGRLVSLSTRDRGILHFYSDSHVTNCCAAWFCPAGTGVGYPKYALREGPEIGYANLAVFFYGCNFNCLFCQNASHKEINDRNLVATENLVKEALGDIRYSCVCYFGGSPEPQLPFALEVSERILEEKGNRVFRICFEWNGCGNPDLVKRACELALNSGGNVKFDLKCYTPNLSLALSGVDNQRAYRNFEMIAEEFYDRRREVPVLTATTLLVPHYVDVQEVEEIAKFIASLNPDIPYSLLIFHPQFWMNDLPVTPVKQVKECYQTAKKHLRRVNIGNIGLLGLGYLTF